MGACRGVVVTIEDTSWSSLRLSRELHATESLRQRGRALFAELRPGTILVLAPGTVHTAPSREPDRGTVR
jgi:hypothetical protein